MTISDQIADWAAGLGLQDVPDDVRHTAKRCLVDTFGVIIAGSATAPGKRALATAQDLYAAGPCMVPGTDVGLSPAGAALVSGTAAHALDFDDTSYTGIMHGSAVSLPAVLGVAQKEERSGEEFLTDFIVAVEATYMIAMMCSTRQYYDGWWTSGSFGMPGATAGAARACGLDASRISEAIGVATIQTSGMKAMFGTDTKPFLAGRSAAVAVEAATAVRHGLTGPRVGFEESRGYINLLNHGEADRREVDNLGNLWRLKQPGILFKQFPICSAAHAGAELAGRLVQENNLSADQVATVRCDVAEVVDISLVYNDPQTPQESQFSMPFAVGCMLCHGGVRPEHIDLKVLNEPELRREMAKVSMHRDDSLAANPSTPEGARVTIETTGGRSFTDILEEPTGMPGAPLSDEQLADKYRACCAFGGFDDVRAEELLAAVWSIETCGNVRDLNPS